jgi:ABC transporter DrrB family efflux protein
MSAITATTLSPSEVAPAEVPPIARISAPAGQPGVFDATATIAGRVVRQFWRTPQLIVVGSLTSAMFLLIFRYVFGGAIDTGDVAYADFLIPALAAGAGLMGGGAVGLAEDVEGGVYDRLRSLPIPRVSVLLGRSLADSALIGFGVLVTLAIGWATGFRFHGSFVESLAAVGLCILFGVAFTWPLIWIGLTAGSAQAAQGMSFLAFPLIFVSSAYVPVSSMPGWLQAVAENQPVTMMVGAVRSLTLGDQADAVLGHSTGWFLVRALVWCVVIVAIFAPLSVRRFSRS